VPGDRGLFAGVAGREQDRDERVPGEERDERCGEQDPQRSVDDAGDDARPDDQDVAQHHQHVAERGERVAVRADRAVEEGHPTHRLPPAQSTPCRYRAMELVPRMTTRTIVIV